MAAGSQDDLSDGLSSDSGMGVGGFMDRGAHGAVGRPRGSGGHGRAWGEEEEEWAVEYVWCAQGGAGRHQAPTIVERMPQAICTNYLRVSPSGVPTGRQVRMLTVEDFTVSCYRETCLWTAAKSFWRSNGPVRGKSGIICRQDKPQGISSALCAENGRAVMRWLTRVNNWK